MGCLTIMRSMALCGGLALLAGCASSTEEDENALLKEQVQLLTDRLVAYHQEVRQSQQEVLQAVATGSHPELGMAAAPLSATVVAPNFGAGEALAQANMTMNHAMTNAPITGDVDRDFLAQMIPHHEGAVEMARILVQNGQREDVRKFAESIIAHQQAEIDLMRYWLSAPATPQ